MEALSFLKFWRSTISISPTIEIPPPLGDDDDSFFELDLSLPDIDTKNSEAKNNHPPSQTTSEKRSTPREPIVSLSPSSLFSKGKIIPIEAPPTPRPQSNISLFKSPPKFRISMFRKSKSMPNQKAGETEEPLYLNRAKSSLSPKMSKFSVLGDGDGEIRGGTDGSLSDGSASKRFSRDGMQRYLKLVKPFSVKGSERDFEDVKLFSVNLPRKSPSSPATARKCVGKGKMTPVNGWVSPARNDDSWAQHHDGIQGAILYCKKSFHSSRDCSLVSKSTNYGMQRELSVPATA